MKPTVLLLALLIATRAAWAVGSDRGQGWDFPNYYNAGARVVHGQMATLYDSTGTIGTRPALGDGRQIYYGVPLSAYAFAPLGLLAPRGALLLFKVLCALCYAAGLALLYRLLRPGLAHQFGASRVLPGFLLAVLLAAPVWFTFEVGGQATAMNFLLLVLFAHDYQAGRDARAALWLTIGVIIKPVLAPMGLVLLVAREWRLVAWGAAWSVLAALLSLAAAGVPLHLTWLDLIRRDAAMLTVPWWNNASIPGALYTFWYGWRLGSLEATAVPAAGFSQVLSGYKLALIALFVALTLWVPSAMDPRRRRLLLTCLGIMFALCFANIIWPHYLAFLAIPLGLFASWLDRIPARGRVVLAAVALATLSVQSRFAQWAVINALSGHPLPQAMIAALCGGVTLLLLLAFLLGWWHPTARALAQSP